MCHLATHDGRCLVLSPFSWHWLMLYIGTFCLFEGYGCLKDAETLWRTDCDLWKPWDSLSHFPSQKVRSNWSNGNQTFVAFSLDSLVHLWETFSTFETDMSDGSGSSRMDSWDLNTSIPSTVITELLPRWSRIELTSWHTQTPRPMMDAFVSWAFKGWVGLRYKDEILPQLYRD